MKNKLFSITFGIMLMGSALIPSVASASTLTAPQVNAIIGLLRAFGVNEATISIVYMDLVPQQWSTGVVQEAPAQVAVQDTAQVVPTCTLTAYVDQLGAAQGKPRAYFGWSFTASSTAVITSQGSPVALTRPIVANDSHQQTTVAGPILTRDTDYEMTVSLNGFTGSCGTHVTVKN